MHASPMAPVGTLRKASGSAAHAGFAGPGERSARPCPGWRQRARAACGAPIATPCQARVGSCRRPYTASRCRTSTPEYAAPERETPVSRRWVARPHDAQAVSRPRAVTASRDRQHGRFAQMLLSS
jgi:hypothetical protein